MNLKITNILFQITQPINYSSYSNSMSVIFNNTFTADKPIYYPSNWQSGKTALEQYNQFKQTFAFFILRNIAQIALSTLWIFIIFVLVVGFKEIIRLKNLNNDSLEKMSNRRYIDNDFIFGVASLGVIIGVMSVILLVQDWGLVVFMKGIVSFTVVYFTREHINKGFSMFFRFLTSLISKQKTKEKKMGKKNEETESLTSTTFTA